MFGRVWRWAGKFRHTERMSVSTPSASPPTCGNCWTIAATGLSTTRIRWTKPARVFITGLSTSILSPTATVATRGWPPTCCSSRWVSRALGKLNQADDHGLLGWCFCDTGKTIAPFSDLFLRHPDIWAFCRRSI
jgi:hypothetical protein